MLWRAPTAAVAIVVGLSALTVSAVIVDDPISITAVQGAGDSSPFAGKVVTVEGVVTADLRGADSLGGVYVQSAESSGIDGASDGIFVSTTARVTIGDSVSISGIVGERDSETRITANEVDVLESDVALPAAIELAPDDDREQFEGMLVTPVGDWSIESTESIDTTGSFTIQATDSTADPLTIDDGYSVTPATRPYLQPTSLFTTGSAFTAAERPMLLGQTSDGYRLEPSSPVDAASDSSYLPTFALDGFVLGEAPRSPQP